MPWLRIVVPVEDLRPGLDEIRRELHVPVAFPEEAERHAEAAATQAPHYDRRDARALPLVSIDPPGSRDLDQAYHAEHTPGGYRVHYAIADVAAFVAAGDPVDLEAWTRGLTLYMPDRRAPLYPAALSEQAASLLPGADRPALLWTIDLDERAEPVGSKLERVLVRNRRAITYAEAQTALDAGSADEPLVLLRAIGELREARERERGGISLTLPVRELTPVNGGYRFSFEAPLPVEGWNAQISLLAGHCAAELMIAGGVGLLRTLPPVEVERVERLRRVAAALGIEWPAKASIGDVVRSQDGRTPASATFLTQVTHALRGAAYEPVGSGPPKVHGGLAMTYAHVTAPLRRLADRYANEIVLALCAGAPPPAWALEALPLLPEAMAEADRRSDRIEGEVLNLAEAVVMAPKVGETFEATVIDRNRERATIQLTEPPVVAKIEVGNLELGARVLVRLTGAYPPSRRLTFTLVDHEDPS